MKHFSLLCTKLLMGLVPVPNKPYVASVDVTQYEEKGTGCVIVAVSAGSEVIKD